MAAGSSSSSMPTMPTPGSSPSSCPSTTSSDHGAPFADIFARVNGDFYKIDGALFSPAEAIVTSVRTGATYRGGRLEPTLVEASFA